MTQNKGNRAFHSFTSRYKPFMKRQAYGLSCSCPDLDREDVYQELLLLAWEISESDGYQAADDPDKYMLASIRRRSLNLIRGDNSQRHVSLDRTRKPFEGIGTRHAELYERFFEDTSCLRNGAFMIQHTEAEESRMAARDILQRAYKEADNFPNTKKGKIYRWVIKSLVRPPESLLNFAQRRESKNGVDNRRSHSFNKGAVGFEVCCRDTIQEYVGCGWRSVRTAIAKMAERLELDDDDS